MEGYQNYQAIIDALKAEYVNARNLKKTATAKKRVATNAKSFKTRKENEKTSLETKLTSVENSLESNLETAFNNLEDARFDTLKSELSELKGKLAFIDADIIRLEDTHQQDPGNIGTYPSAEPTSIESQSLTVLRNMLSVTIADAELVITNLYDGQDYAAIKSATVPRMAVLNGLESPSTEQEVRSYYHDLQSRFDQLFDKTKEELDDFVISIFTTGNEVNILKDQLIDHSGELVTFKSQLADLLNDEGTEAEINAKEQQIENLKEIMLTKATDLKQIEVGIGSAMTAQKLVKLKRYATDLNSLTEELRGYRWENHGFLKNEFPNPDFDIAYRSFVLYSGFFEFMDNNQFLNTPRGFNNGQWTEFKLLKQQITQAKEYYRTDSQFRDNAYDDTNVLYQTQQLFDCNQRNNGNGTEYYNITDFRPEVSQATKDFYVNYSRQLHNATSNYMWEMHSYKFYKNAIQQHIQDFEGIVYQQDFNISALRSVKMQELWLQEDRTKKGHGHYVGTQEQDSLLSNTRGAWFEAEAEYLRQFYTNRTKVKTFELYNSIFPEFYSGLSTLESTKDNLYNQVLSIDTTYTDLTTSRDTAYALLQTLTVGEADYVAALADYESKVAVYDLALAELFNKATSRNASYDFLQTTLAGQAEWNVKYPFESYEANGSVNNSFAYVDGFDDECSSTATQTDGKILVVGDFLYYNGTLSKRIIRLNPDGSRDTSFVTGTGFNGSSNVVAIQSDGKIVVGGDFSSYNGTSANRIIRLNSDGSVDTSFVYGLGFDGAVWSIAIQSDGKIVVGGNFNRYTSSIPNAKNIIRLNSDGSVDTSFVYGTGFNFLVHYIAIQSDGKILVGGEFSDYNGTSANRIIRLNSDGSIDTSFVSGTGFYGGQVHSFDIQSDGKILVGGNFNRYASSIPNANNIIRLNSDGSIDTSFVIGIGFDDQVWSIDIDQAGKILVGGQFNSYNETGASHIIRLNSDGSADTSFVTDNGFIGKKVKNINIQSNGSILVVGAFTAYKSGISANRIVMLSGGGSYPQTEIDRITALHYVYLGAQSDYDTKSAAKDAYWNDVVTPAEVLKNDAYTFLQNLTDEDAAYQAGLIDWNSKVDATDLFYNETLVPAHDAYNTKAVELDQYLSFNYGSELNLSYTGTALKGFKNDRDVSVATLEQANTIKSATEAAFMVARNSMTFVQSTPLEKRQGMRMENDVHKLHRQVERLESLANRYSEIFPIMVNQAESFASEVRSRDEAYFTGLLQSVKDFMDGFYSNNLGSNLYVNKLNNYKAAEMHAGKYQLRLNTIFKPLLRDWHMSFGSNNNQDEHINIADAQYNAIQPLSTDTGIDRFRQTISSINNELFRNVEGFNFGYRIIDEVTNGTPLV